MTLTLQWVDGGTADVIDTDGQRVVLRSSRPGAPGQPLAATCSVIPGTLRVKVHSCKRQSDGEFCLEGRWLDLTRAVREEILGTSASAKREEP